MPMSESALPTQVRQLSQQRSMLRRVLSLSRDLPSRQNQPERAEAPKDQQQHVANQ
jgi:hypothetical protein